MKVSDIMSTDPVTLTPGHTVREASRIFLEHEIDGAPVVDEHGRMVGLLTKSHLYRVLPETVIPTPRSIRSWPPA